MKISPIVIIVFIAACAASGYAGFYAGQQGAPTPAPAVAADAKTAPNATPKPTLTQLLKTPDTGDLAAWAAGLSAKECADMLAELQAMKPGAARDAAIAAVLESWAKSDPKGVLATSGQVRSPKLRETGVDAALKNWAAKDSAAALQWLKDNPGTASTSAAQARFAAVIAGYASTDPKGAFDTVSALDEKDMHSKSLKTEAFKALADVLAGQGRFNDALTMFGSLPAGEIRDEAIDNVAKQWAAAAPEDAAAWSVAITDQSERLRIQGQVANAWAGSDPMAAAAWAVELDRQSGVKPDPENPTIGPGMILANAILAWSEYDIDGPGDFLNQLPNSEGKDRAVAVFAMHAAEEDPEGAAKWLGSIGDQSLRGPVIMAVGVQMYQQDPAMFNNFIDTTDAVPEAQRQGLKQMMPLVSTSMAMVSSMTGGKANLLTTMMDGLLTGKASPMMNQIRTMQTQLQRAGGARGMMNAAGAAGGQPPAP